MLFEEWHAARGQNLCTLNKSHLQETLERKLLHMDACKSYLPAYKVDGFSYIPLTGPAALYSTRGSCLC
jgi:hypothetical protein